MSKGSTLHLRIPALLDGKWCQCGPFAPLLYWIIASPKRFTALYPLALVFYKECFWRWSILKLQWIRHSLGNWSFWARWIGSKHCRMYRCLGIGRISLNMLCKMTQQSWLKGTRGGRSWKGRIVLGKERIGLLIWLLLFIMCSHLLWIR